MALRPTPQEECAIVDVLSLATWCGISATPPANPSNTTPAPVSDMQALFGYLVCGVNEHYRGLATISLADWAQSTRSGADILVNGRRHADAAVAEDAANPTGKWAVDISFDDVPAVLLRGDRWLPKLACPFRDPKGIVYL